LACAVDIVVGRSQGEKKTEINIKVLNFLMELINNNNEFR